MVSRRKQALDHLRSRYPLDCNTLSMMIGAKVLMLQQIKVATHNCWVNFVLDGHKLQDKLFYFSQRLLGDS